MREEECSGINCAEESYGAGGWLLRMASGADLPAQPPAETRGWLLRMPSGADFPAQPRD